MAKRCGEIGQAHTKVLWRETAWHVGTLDGTLVGTLENSKMATVTEAQRGDRTRCSKARKGQQKPHLAKVQSARHEKEHFSRRSQLDCRGTSL